MAVSREGTARLAWVSSAARCVKPYRELLEFALLTVGAVYGLAFLVRTWPYPRATLSLEVLERAAGDANADNLVVRAAFEVGDSANLTLQPPQTSCRVLDTQHDCSGTCTDIGPHLDEGIVPRGEGVSWACRYRVPAGACVEVSQLVVGRAAGISAAASHWGSSTISCGGKDK
jgi:hypothetical protein